MFGNENLMPPSPRPAIPRAQVSQSAICSMSVCYLSSSEKSPIQRFTLQCMPQRKTLYHCNRKMERSLMFYNHNHCENEYIYSFLWCKYTNVATEYNCITTILTIKWWWWYDKRQLQTSVYFMYIYVYTSNAKSRNNHAQKANRYDRFWNVYSSAVSSLDL